MLDYVSAFVKYTSSGNSRTIIHLAPCITLHLANAEMVPKTPSCHYMLLMLPSRLKFISN